MGAAISSSMAEVQKKNMAEGQYRMMQRQMTMQMEIQKRMMAVQVARTRDLFMYFATFYGLVVPPLLIRGLRTHDPRFLVPIIPLTIIGVYQWDMAYGTKLDRIRAEATRLLESDPDRFGIPGAPLRVSAIDEAVARTMEDPVVDPWSRVKETAEVGVVREARR